MGGLQQFLGGNAPDMQAGAAECPLLHETHVQSYSRGVEGGCVPRRATADDDHIVLCHIVLSIYRTSSPCGPHVTYEDSPQPTIISS